MKIKHLKVSAIVMTGCLVASSCVGSFQLTHKLAMWNTRATDTKFLNEIIFLLISPAYAVCGVVDALVINSMEFWSGSNPLAKNEGKTQNEISERVGVSQAQVSRLEKSAVARLKAMLM